ncbi:DUF4403 family protein [Flavobacterium sp. NRK F10]|uniref:DUF4403 family protein n=1 Tax=Flavobacterium sp. NRK F10 TaxID=2954931 RepID=UPI002090BBBE|nr:DUF4403 family protein [Flavobacterium sp. NRK F10]MCO6174469.1 DUF4403 family protein [Flavobacterium sp. NRK F10]
MNKNKYILTLLLATVLISCKSYKEITKKPDRLHDAIEMPSYESKLIVGLKADLSTLEDQINEAFKNGYNDQGEGTFQYKSWIKTKDPLYDPSEVITTKNPLYNPNKWIKTKDPLYDPRKWIKVGPIKTKNPLYHPNKWIEIENPAYDPNEWIKTKNPLYHPNEWIETKGPEVAVGYQYQYALRLKDKVKLSYFDNNTIKVSVPIAFKGKAGLKGKIPAGLDLDKKNFDGEINFYINTRVFMTPEWCPKVEADVTHSWISNPQLEIIDNVYISLTNVADKYIKKIEEDVDEIIYNKIDCDLFRNTIQERWKHYNFSLPTLVNDKQYQLNINPTGAALSSLKVYKDSIALFVGVRGNITIDDNIINTTATLPLLEEQVEVPSEVKSFLPFILKYEDISGTANKYLKEKKVELQPELILKKKAHIKLKKIDIYPNGDEVVVGVKLKAKLPGNLFPVSGWVYLIGKPTMTDNKKFELKNLDFSMDVDNKFYPVISSLFKPLIIREVKKQTTRDLSEPIEDLKKKLLEKANAYQHDKIGFVVNSLDVGVYDIVLGKDDIGIITELNSTFDVFLKE